MDSCLLALFRFYYSPAYFIIVLLIIVPAAVEHAYVVAIYEVRVV